MPASKQDPQGYGSALTYARRYSLMACVGIAPEDDDGNAASHPKKSSVNESQMADHLAAIDVARNEDELKKAHIEAYKACGTDVVWQKKIIAAKDAKKAELAKKASSSNE